jgi:diguanylate cyclase (GGDEF)-like protein
MTMNSLSPPRIVSMIAELTDHRDVDLLEASLLRTVADLFAPAWAAIFHTSDNDVPKLSNSLRDGIISQTEGTAAFSELISTEDVASFPIMSHARKVLGYLLVHRTPELSDDEQALMTDLFRVYDNYLAVLKDSQVDRLTGLLNRHTFDDQLERALGVIRRACPEGTGTPSKRKVDDGDGCFFMGEIDIDHFKSVNDRYGHPVGDDVLRGVAAILCACCRASDTPSRYGGDEFLIVLPDTDVARAAVVAERIRQRCSAFRCERVPELRLTVSVGAAEPDSEMREADAWIQKADAALYEAKASGRDRFVGVVPRASASSAGEARLARSPG